MGKEKLDSTHRTLLKFVAVVLLVCLWMAVGTAFARYRYKQTDNLTFAPQTTTGIHLFGGVAGDGSFTQLPAGFTDGVNGQELRFLISNGTAKDTFAQQDTRVRVRLAGTLGLGSGDNLHAQLTVNGTVYTATVKKIDVQSPMYITFGEGWLCCFEDAKGNELIWELEGGQLSYTQMDLCIQTAEGVDISMLQLLVTAE